MTEYPKNIKFKYSWRKYQQRVLDDLQDHLTDGHLHVIAPSGSGKTVLGLEVAIRLNKPTLILAPTIAIRNQWIQRFCELFLQTSFTPDWISRDIRIPKFMTVVTYQGLHAACNNLRIKDDEMVYEPDDKFDIRNSAIIKTTTQKINYANILTAIGHTDFPPRQPRLDNHGPLTGKEVYLVNMDRKLIFHMYDDRGLDIIATDTETIRPIYTKHNDWILDYDRERIDKQFRDKNPL